MNKKEKEKINNHQKVVKIVETDIAPIIISNLETINKEFEEKYGVIDQKNKSLSFELSLKNDSNGNPKVSIDFLGEFIPKESFKEVNSSQVGDLKYISFIKENQFKKIGIQLLKFIRTLDPKGKLKKSESTNNKFTNYHIKNNKIYYNDNWNFVAFTIQNDGIKVNIYTGEYSPNKIEVFYESPYPYFKIADSYQIEDAKKLIKESYDYKYKQYFGL